MALRSINRAGGELKHDKSYVFPIFLPRFQSSLPLPSGSQRVVGSSTSTSTSTHDKNNDDDDDDVVSRCIRKSLDNDDGRDYGEGNGRPGRREGEGDVSGFVGEKARKGVQRGRGVGGGHGADLVGGRSRRPTRRSKNDRRNDKAADDRLRKDGAGDSKWHA